jgi:hypothetical protein
MFSTRLIFLKNSVTFMKKLFPPYKRENLEVQKIISFKRLLILSKSMFIYYKMCYSTSMKFQNSNSSNTLTHYLSCFSTNYITFRSIESFEYYFFEIKNVCDVNYWFFKNIVFVEMKSSKLINYSTKQPRSDSNHETKIRY